MTQKGFSLAIKVFIGAIIVGLISLSVYFYVFLFGFEMQPIFNGKIPVEDIDLDSYQKLIK